MQLNYQKKYIFFGKLKGWSTGSIRTVFSENKFQTGLHKPVVNPSKIHLRSQDFYMKSGLITQGKFVIFHNITHESLFGNYSGSLIEFQYFDPWILWVPYPT